METVLVGQFNLGDGWQCTCGKTFFLTGEYCEEHWWEEVKFQCSRCDTKYSLHSGELHREIDVPELSESP